MMKITFDPEKRATTLTVRGLDMARADEVFTDLVVTLADDRNDYGEIRFISVGYLDGRMVLVAWTPRGTTRRIISMRKANDREQARYGNGS
jgi:uncharacterized protein